MRRGAALAIVAAGLALAPSLASANACDEGGRAEAARRVESAKHVLVFRPAPAVIAVGRHFAVEAVVCPRDAAQPATGLRIDATMPAHRHGMNYRAAVTVRGDGRFLAEGLMFHMPGRWQLVFDVETAAGVDRLVSDVVLE
jgi:hypothetical protein